MQVALDSAVQSIQRTAKVNVVPSGKLHQAKSARLNFQGLLQPHYQCVTPLCGHVFSSATRLIAASFQAFHPTCSEAGMWVEGHLPGYRNSHAASHFESSCLSGKPDLLPAVAKGAPVEIAIQGLDLKAA